MNERHNFILIVDINAETFRATNKRRLGKTHPTFFVALLWNPGKKRDRTYTIDLTG